MLKSLTLNIGLLEILDDWGVDEGIGVGNRRKTDGGTEGENTGRSNWSWWRSCEELET